jgi:SAM-dependent methyltransferase
MTPDFDARERQAWAGQATAFAGSFGKLCAHTVPMLLDAAGPLDGARLLDVGTGTGAAASAALARGAEVSAVDAEPDMIAYAARALPGADVRRAVLPALPFGDGAFDAVVGNFVLNHVGRPAAALAELRRVARPGGRVALTIWASPAAPGKALLGRALHATGVADGLDLPALAPEDDFPRDEAGFAGLLSVAGLTDVSCVLLAWDHRTTVDEWWSGPASGVATPGQALRTLPPETVTAVRDRFAALAEEFTTADGTLALPHTALLARGRVPAQSRSISARSTSIVNGTDSLSWSRKIPVSE